MTREEAKNWLNKLYARADITDEYGDMEDMQPYEEAVNMAIQALEQTRWIPVSKKLPEVNQRVLVTSYGRVCYAMMISADGNSGYPIFKLQDSLNERVICETTVHSEFTTSRITAWMPLPSCYEPQESVLDKIRAEIAEYKDDKVIHAERNEMIDIVLEIIDKYK